MRRDRARCHRPHGSGSVSAGKIRDGHLHPRDGFLGHPRDIFAVPSIRLLKLSVPPGEIRLYGTSPTAAEVIDDKAGVFRVLSLLR